MAEPTVQVPVSLPTREQIAEAQQALTELGDSIALPDTQAGEDWFTERMGLVTDIFEAVLALLSQPTPTAEAIDAVSASCVDGATPEQQRETAEPPRIEDMAPGKLPCADPNINRWYCQRRADGTCPLPKCIDPSTIRDVTPPAVTE